MIEIRFGERLLGKQFWSPGILGGIQALFIESPLFFASGMVMFLLHFLRLLVKEQLSKRSLC